MSKQDRIKGLIDEASKMRRHHDDLHFTPTLTDEERAFHATKYHYYRGRQLALSQALSIIEEEV